MIINKSSLILYNIVIIFGILNGLLYIVYSLYKDNISKKEIFKYFILFIVLAIFGGKLYTFISSGFKVNLFKAGLSGYGGLLFTIFGSIYFSYKYSNTKYIRYTVISLPLIYSITKLACFVSGCCYGIVYNGPFSIKYPFIDSYNHFPIQLVESLLFMVIFEICNYNKNKKSIVYITLFLVFIFKFLLDFLRYDHTTMFITFNQVISIILFIDTLIIYKKRI